LRSVVGSSEPHSIDVLTFFSFSDQVSSGPGSEQPKTGIWSWVAAGIVPVSAPDPASHRMAVDHQQLRYYPNGQFCQEPGPNFFGTACSASELGAGSVGCELARSAGFCVK